MFHKSYMDRIKQTDPTNLVRYYTLNDRSGTSARDESPHATNGTYNNTTLANTIGPDGRMAPYFSSINSNVDIVNNMPAHCDPHEATILAWVKPYDVNVWADGTNRSILDIYSDGYDDRIRIYKDGGASDDDIVFKFIGDGDEWSKTQSGVSTTGWTCVAMKWIDGISAVADGEFEAFWNGVSLGTSVIDDTSGWKEGEPVLHAWIGAGINGTSNEWYGYIDHVALWCSVLTNDQIRDLSKI